MSRLFESITIWQAEDYMVKVRRGAFLTMYEALAYGRQPLRLVNAGTCLQLFSPETGLVLDEASDADVELLRLRPECRSKNVVNETDYEPVALRIADYGQVPALASFGSLSYGARETEVEVRRSREYAL